MHHTLSNVYALLARPQFGLLFQEYLAPVLVPLWQDCLLACSLFAESAHAFLVQLLAKHERKFEAPLFHELVDVRLCP
jgi:hypothetical protein